MNALRGSIALLRELVTVLRESMTVLRESVTVLRELVNARDACVVTAVLLVTAAATAAFRAFRQPI